MILQEVAKRVGRTTIYPEDIDIALKEGHYSLERIEVIRFEVLALIAKQLCVNPRDCAQKVVWIKKI